MVRFVQVVVGGLSVGLLLVGCSHLLSQHRPVPGPAVEAREQPPLEPGVERVTVGRVATDAATIWWKSPWQGQSTVVYGRDSHLVPVVVERSAPTADQFAALDHLEPGTRYYFQVETATPLGVARSAVVSFRTADTPVMDTPTTPQTAGKASTEHVAVIRARHVKPRLASRARTMHLAAKHTTTRSTHKLAARHDRRGPIRTASR